MPLQAAFSRCQRQAAGRLIHMVQEFWRNLFRYERPRKKLRLNDPNRTALGRMWLTHDSPLGFPHAEGEGTFQSSGLDVE